MKKEIRIKKKKIILDSLGSLFIVSTKTIVIADLHIGKVGYFREKGKNLPRGLLNTELGKLKVLFETYNPKKVVFLGDLFHATKNVEWDIFEDFISNNNSIDFILTRGNHDRFIRNLRKSKIDIVDSYSVDNFLMTHNRTKKGKYLNLYGHIHPGYSIVKGKEKIKLKCFVVGKDYILLPALGEFTGAYNIKNKMNYRNIYIIGKNFIRKV